MCMCAISTGLVIFVQHIHNQDGQQSVPRLVRIVFILFLSKAMCMNITPPTGKQLLQTRIISDSEETNRDPCCITLPLELKEIRDDIHYLRCRFESQDSSQLIQSEWKTLAL